MATSEVATLSRTVLQIAATIQQLGNNWYRASADWEDFPRKVNILRRKLDFWLVEFTRFAMLSDASLIETLNDARVLLEEEQARLLQRQARCCAGLWPKVCMTMFPAKVGMRIQLAISAFDAIPGLLQEEEEATVALEKRMMRKASPLQIFCDERYVPLQDTESRVSTALNNPLDNSQVPLVILLHGGPGTGKSTLARHIELINLPAAPMTLFKAVIFLECGPNASTLTAQFELLQRLGSGASVASQEQGHMNSDLAIPGRLASLLKHQKVLIIFDDVWEGEFLQRMIDLCGVGVKCLVTSQRADLCWGLSFSPTRIRIEDIQQDVAMKILASHVGFPNKRLPEHIQGLAHKLIQETHGNPLALASVATAIEYDRSDELEEWEAASRNFLKLLDSKHPAHIFGIQYSKSFWSAMRLSIQSLNEDAQRLLILVHMCDGPSIPEEILRIFYLSVVHQDASETFEKSRKYLESRELLKINSEPAECNSLQKQRSWSVHSLQKKFIEDEMSSSKELMFKELARIRNENSFESAVHTKVMREISEDEDLKVQVALCALYLEKPFSERAASMMQIPIDNLDNLRKMAIAPITQLLGQPVSDRWTAPAHSCAKEIFVKYIYNRALHETGIMSLLEFPISNLRMLRALYDIATIEETILLDANLMKALVSLLGMDTSDSSIAKAAARAIDQLSRNKLNYGIIISSGILDETVKILLSTAHSDLQVTSSNILAALSYAGSEIGDCRKIMENRRVLEVLVKSLFDENNPSLQVTASMAFTNLAATESKEAKLKIICFPKVLDQLISLLSKVTIPNLQIQATKALANLAIGVEETKLRIINSSRAVEELLNMLSQDNNPALQLQAARTFVTLSATTVEDAKQKLINYSGVLEQLVHCMSMSNNSPVRKDAAHTIRNLSELVLLHGNTEFARKKFNETKGLMDGLFGFLIDQVDQGLAVMALTYIDPARANREVLHSALHYSKRGYANLMLGQNKEALEDLNKADEIRPGDIFTLRNRVTVRAWLGDFSGALADSNSVIKVKNTSYNVQERGVLKRMAGDFSGALVDFDQVLDSDPDDYECLKHRGYVRFLMKDENGARSDAELALKFHSSSLPRPGYKRDCLGSASVEFLDYKLR